MNKEVMFKHILAESRLNSDILFDRLDTPILADIELCLQEDLFNDFLSKSRNENTKDTIMFYLDAMTPHPYAEHKLILLYTCDEWKYFKSTQLIGAIDTANPYWKSLLLLTFRTLYDNDYIELNKADFLSNGSMFSDLVDAQDFISVLNDTIKYLYITTMATNDIDIE